jgi:HD-GYP domain-containing protein (c-di-GMP phosphodiesterase class II)
LAGGEIDSALAAMGELADLASPYLAGHSTGFARLASAVAMSFGLDVSDRRELERAALVHDVGRVAVPVRIWQKRGSLNPGEWERVRLHA